VCAHVTENCGGASTLWHYMCSESVNRQGCCTQSSQAGAKQSASGAVSSVTQHISLQRHRPRSVRPFSLAANNNYYDKSRTEYRIRLRVKYQDMHAIKYAINIAIYDTIQHTVPSLNNGVQIYHNTLLKLTQSSKASCQSLCSSSYSESCHIPNTLSMSCAISVCPNIYSHLQVELCTEQTGYHKILSIRKFLIHISRGDTNSFCVWLQKFGV